MMKMLKTVTFAALVSFTGACALDESSQDDQVLECESCDGERAVPSRPEIDIELDPEIDIKPDRETRTPGFSRSNGPAPRHDIDDLHDHLDEAGVMIQQSAAPEGHDIEDLDDQLENFEEILGEL